MTANAVTIGAAVLSLFGGTALAISRGALLLLLPAALFARLVLAEADGD